MTRMMPRITAALAAVLLTTSCAKDIVQPPSARSYDVKVLTPSSGALAGATVMLQTPGQNFVASTDGAGIARISVPNTVTLPAWVILVATHSSILPQAFNCPGQQSVTSAPTVSTIAMPSLLLTRDVYLHHVGNNVYSGDANSQLQLSSEGLSVTYSFSLNALRATMPTFRIFARGVQHPTEIYLNGKLVNRLGSSSGDGSLSTYAFQMSGYPQNYLKVGSNTLTIKTGANDPTGDLWDDIEFCGLSLYYP